MAATEDWKQAQRAKHHARVQAAVDRHPEEALRWAQWNYIMRQQAEARKKGKRS
jgi:hypothetical protein